MPLPPKWAWATDRAKGAPSTSGMSARSFCVSVSASGRGASGVALVFWTAAIVSTTRACLTGRACAPLIGTTHLVNVEQQLRQTPVRGRAPTADSSNRPVKYTKAPPADSSGYWAPPSGMEPSRTSGDGAAHLCQPMECAGWVPYYGTTECGNTTGGCGRPGGLAVRQLIWSAAVCSRWAPCGCAGALQKGDASAVGGHSKPTPTTHQLSCTLRTFGQSAVSTVVEPGSINHKW